MRRVLQFEEYGMIRLSEGLPSDFSRFLLPQAFAFHANGPWGTICLQEIETQGFLLRHFLFSLQKTISFYLNGSKGIPQSLLSLNGRFEHSIQGQQKITLHEKEYLLFSTAGQETRTTVYQEKVSSLLNAHYTSYAYNEFLPVFQDFERDLKKTLTEPYYFNQSPGVARHTVHEAINAIWQDNYIPSLVTKHIELRLKSTLFTLLAQSYTQIQEEPLTPIEKEKSFAAREIILRDITEHKTPNQIASELYCSAAWLKKAFSKVYGIGMFHFLRSTRMERAREMLLRGESLKAVALEVGMKPSNFPKEFKSFFGYTVTALKKGQV